jgi:hypothetical protein
VIFTEPHRDNNRRGIGRRLDRPASTIGRALTGGRRDDRGYRPHAVTPVDEKRRACVKAWVNEVTLPRYLRKKSIGTGRMFSERIIFLGLKVANMNIITRYADHNFQV